MPRLNSLVMPGTEWAGAAGGHGYGLRHTELPITAWPELVETWLRTIRMLPASAP